MPSSLARTTAVWGALCIGAIVAQPAEALAGTGTSTSTSTSTVVSPTPAAGPAATTASGSRSPTTTTTTTTTTSAPTTTSAATATVPKVSGTVASTGYLMATTHGAVLSYGNVPLSGSVGTVTLAAPVVGIAATPTGDGYWLAGADGGIFSFGAARYSGSIGQLDPSTSPGGANSIALNQPIVAVSTTWDGKGYWLAAADGGIFAFGDAGYYGSMGGTKLAGAIVGMAPTPDSHGYWLVGADGGIFGFGDAGYYGSASQLNPQRAPGGTNAANLSTPIVAMAATPDGRGYWFVASGGGIFTFGDAGFFGSMGLTALAAPIVGMGASPDGQGYWEAGADGGVFSFGDAPFRGSDGQAHDLFYPVDSFVAAPGSGTDPGNGASEGLDRYATGAEGYDISWPQCPSGNFPPPAALAVVGINNGHAMSTNPCFAAEAAWAGAAMSIYMNADFFDTSSPPPPSAMKGPAGTCASTDLVCQGYNYGWASAAYAVNAAQGLGYFVNLWWLDVERGNNWSGSPSANASDIQAMLDYLHSQGIVVGIYSTSYQWGIIAGSFQPGVPNWYATGMAGDPPFDCNKGFTGGPTWLVQASWSGSNGNFDGDFAC